MSQYDVVVVGAGPAGAVAALSAMHTDPNLSVALLDRAEFPRDKVCGDGIAPHVIDLLESIGVPGITADRRPVRRLRLARAGRVVERELARAAWVVPRSVFDARLVAAAQSAGVMVVRHRVRSVDVTEHSAVLDGALAGRVLVGADGAHSVVRRSQRLGDGPTAIALRGYVPTPASCSGAQLIAFGTSRQPSYAWCFDRGDGLSNVGYGELLTHTRTRPTRGDLLVQLERLLPGSSDGDTEWRGHHLPLSGWRWRPARGRVLLAGDAARLVNPLTGEGIFYAVATGLLAGSAAAAALRAGLPSTAGARYRSAVRPLLRRHLRHTSTAARLSLCGPVLDAGIRASAADQRVFDDLVELGLAGGTITTAIARGLAGAITNRHHGDPGVNDSEEMTCGF